jgi:hypothetical protein
VNSTEQGPAPPSITGTSWAGCGDGVGVGDGDCARRLKAIARIDNCQTLKIEDLSRQRIWLSEINFGDLRQSRQFWQSKVFGFFSAVKT